MTIKSHMGMVIPSLGTFRLLVSKRCLYPTGSLVRWLARYRLERQPTLGEVQLAAVR